MKLLNPIFGVTTKIYMKSGNVITLKHVKELSIKANGQNISYLKITKMNFWNLFNHENLLVESICLPQIEAITSE